MAIYNLICLAIIVSQWSSRSVPPLKTLNLHVVLSVCSQHSCTFQLKDDHFRYNFWIVIGCRFSLDSRRVFLAFFLVWCCLAVFGGPKKQEKTFILPRNVWSSKELYATQKRTIGLLLHCGMFQSFQLNIFFFLLKMLCLFSLTYYSSVLLQPVIALSARLWWEVLHKLYLVNLSSFTIAPQVGLTLFQPFPLLIIQKNVDNIIISVQTREEIFRHLSPFFAKFSIDT